MKRLGNAAPLHAATLAIRAPLEVMFVTLAYVRVPGGPAT